MALKIKPAPGMIIVKPLDGSNDRYKNIELGGTGKNVVSRGEVMAIPTPSAKMMNASYPGEVERIPLKVGMVVFYRSEEPLTVTENDVIYHLINMWSIEAYI